MKIIIDFYQFFAYFFPRQPTITQYENQHDYTRTKGNSIFQTRDEMGCKIPIC